MTTPRPELRYLDGGRVAHLVEGTAALCGVAPRPGAWWLGGGSAFERGLAEALPLCKACEKS